MFMQNMIEVAKSIVKASTTAPPTKQAYWAAAHKLRMPYWDFLDLTSTNDE
jgi:hypothetical protein